MLLYNKMFLIDVIQSKAKNKKLAAVFCPCKTKSECKGSRYKTVNFGLKGSTTFTNGASEQTKDAYIARHRTNENWNIPTTAGSLSKHLLWGPSRSLLENIKSFKRKFNL